MTSIKNITLSIWINGFGPTSVIGVVFFNFKRDYFLGHFDW
jgi:hypothetical protein